MDTILIIVPTFRECSIAYGVCYGAKIYELVFRHFILDDRLDKTMELEGVPLTIPFDEREGFKAQQSRSESGFVPYQALQVVVHSEGTRFEKLEKNAIRV